ncbi:cytochrome c3 family protein [Fontivita pretiosa]|uniref:cytochrome c3 family protein n=1 Tax=Fontivita pretiosa TaxID=2989684 RepID=UPI003D18771D
MRPVHDNRVAWLLRRAQLWPLPMMLMAALLASRVYAQTTRPLNVVAKPTEAVPMASCVTAQCHAEVKDFKVLHGPVNVNACDACHKLTDAAQHKFELQRSKTETCTFCHKIDVQDMPVVHKPLQEGQCLSCHNPHGGATAKFTRGRTLAELCNTCHKDVVAGRKTLHGPAAAGACGSCHQSHAAPFPKLLPAQGPDLCLSCHTEMKTQMTQVKFTHKAVEQNCTNCHDPHASDFPRQIRQSPFEMCTSCHEHEKIKRDATQSRYKHSIVTTDNACLNCHTAHGGDLARLMRAEPIKVCMKCHADKIQVGKDKVVASVAEVLDPNTVKHGPIRDGNCGGCHNVHGSEVARLLSKPYPEPFYQGFSVDKYELCFSCHDKQLVLTQRTEGLTGFRNGTQNLHFVHVNKPDRGRNCRACHSTHASSHELHVRDSVPYGNWQMPINFTRTATGGSCAPGCHKAYSYDRENPVQYTPPTQAPPAPATMPAAPTATIAPAANSPTRGK